MRVAIANAGICSSMGGSERAAIRLAYEMMKRGHDTRILTVRSQYPPLYQIDPRIPLHFFPETFLRADYKALIHGPELLRDNAIDVLVSFESDWKHLLWGDIADQAGVPHVVSERNTPWIIENEYWNRQARRDLLRTRAAIHELLPCYMDFIPADNRNKTFVIPNAAPIECPESFPQRHGKPVLLYLGRFSKKKRPALLLEAFSLIAQEFPDWTLRFAGWGEEEAQLQKKRTALGLDNRVEIRMAHTDVNLEYLAGSIYCLPSLYEGFPNAVLEAMSNGLPVVGIADCKAMASIINPGQTGLLANMAAPESLADALRPLMASKDARERMGANAWEDARLNYGDSVFDSWEKELIKVMEARN